MSLSWGFSWSPTIPLQPQSPPFYYQVPPAAPPPQTLGGPPIAGPLRPLPAKAATPPLASPQSLGMAAFSGVCVVQGAPLGWDQGAWL